MSGPAAPAPPARWRDFWIDVGWLAVLMAWAAGWCLSASARTGVTFDEPFYLNNGMDEWRGRWAEKTALHGVMPLPVAAATAPVYLRERRAGEKIESPIEHLHRARPVTLGWLLLLTVSVLRLGRAAGGPWAGRVAAGLVAADPTFLAHSSLATTDIAASASLLAFTRAVYAGRDGGWWRRVTLPGLWYGVAVLCKLSNLLYGGVVLVALEVAYRYSSGALSRPPGASAGGWARRAGWAVARSVLAAAAVIGIGVAIAVAACGVSEPGGRPLQKVAEKAPENEPLSPVLRDLAARHDRVPYAAVAFAFQAWRNAEGRSTFLNGTYYPEGVWFYFPVLLAMKLPLPVMLLGLAALARPRAAANALAFATLLLLGVTLTAKLQIGVRLVLPVVAVGYAAVAVAVCRGFPRWGPRAGLAAVAVTAGVSAWVWPNGLGYLNQLAGGPAAAAARVTDSNLDWGQGIPDLLAWHRANGEPPIALWYFGSDPAASKLPFGLLQVEKLPIKTADEFRAAVGRGVLAVGATVISLDPDSREAKVVALDHLRTLTPIARTPTFVIYDFRDPAPGR